MSGKRYPEEFKIEAVKQVIDRGHSVSSDSAFIAFFRQHTGTTPARHLLTKAVENRHQLTFVSKMPAQRVIQITACQEPDTDPHNSR